MKGSHIVVMVTVANREEAEKIVHNLLDEKLIACANIIGPVSSLFRWAGKVERADEHLLLMKSRLDLFERLSKKVKALHSYEVPEIIVLSTIRGSPSYMNWFGSCLRQ